MIAYCSNCGSKTQARQVANQSLSFCAACDQIFFRNPKVVVTGLIEDDGRVLLVKRDIEPGRGLWGLPGGFVDWNEHPEQAMVRECREEVCIEVAPLELLAVQHIVQGEEGLVLLPYRARLLAGTPAACDEVQEVGWFAPDRLPTLAFTMHRAVLQQWARDVQARGAA